MKKLSVKRIIVMLVGIVLIGLGIALFKLSLMGNDSSTALALAVSDRTGVALAIIMIILNCLYFVVEIIFDRHLIGVGTFVNWFGVGVCVTFWNDLVVALLGAPEGLAARIVFMLVGVVILGLAASLYQTANLGIAPYDALSIVLSERLPVPYFWCRIFTDVVCAVLAYLMGGIVGAGTVVCSLGLGPFISFFNRTVSEPICGKTTSAVQ